MRMEVNGRFSEAQGYHLRRAILIYESEINSVATLHSIAMQNNKKSPVILPGQPLSRNDFLGIVDTLNGLTDKQEHSVIPENVLCRDAELLAWHIPSHRRRIFFSTSNKQFNADVNGREVLHPALLFVAKSNGLYVFALASDERPEVSTHVFRAPYMNLYGTGHLCEGTFRFPENLTMDGIPEWERGFFETHFSHTNMNARELTSFDGGHDALWRAMTKTRCKRFPVKSLVPMMTLAPKGKKSQPMTVGQVLNQ
jgi:PRTRC genetic system protein B